MFVVNNVVILLEKNTQRKLKSHRENTSNLLSDWSVNCIDVDFAPWLSCPPHIISKPQHLEKSIKLKSWQKVGLAYYYDTHSVQGDILLLLHVKVGCNYQMPCSGACYWMTKCFDEMMVTLRLHRTMLPLITLFSEVTHISRQGIHLSQLITGLSLYAVTVTL